MEQNSTTPAFPTLTPFAQKMLFVMIITATTVLPLNDLAMFNMLTAIKHDLHMSNVSMQWLITLYLTVAACVIVPAGRYSDYYGRFNVFIVGLFFFFIGELLLSIGTDVWLVIIGRIFTGVASGIYLTIGGALLNTAIPESKRGHVLILWMGFLMFGIALGPFLAGLFVDYANWRLMFWICLGLTILALICALWLRKFEKVTSLKIGIDYLGVFLLTIFLISYVLIFSEGFNWGWTSPVMITLYAVCGATLLLFVIWEFFPKAPLISFSACKSIPYIAALIMIFATQFAWLPLMYIYCNYAASIFGLHYSIFMTGVTLIPFAIIPFFISVFCSKILGKFGLLPPLLISSISLFAGFLLLSFVNAQTSYVDIWWRLVLCGIGVTFPWLTLLPIALSELPTELSGLAAGTFEVFRFTGSVIGVGIASSVMLATVGKHLIQSGFHNINEIIQIGLTPIKFLTHSHISPQLLHAGQTSFAAGYTAAIYVTLIGSAVVLGTCILYAGYQFACKK